MSRLIYTTELVDTADRQPMTIRITSAGAEGAEPGRYVGFEITTREGVTVRNFHISPGESLAFKHAFGRAAKLTMRAAEQE